MKITMKKPWQIKIIKHTALYKNACRMAGTILLCLHLTHRVLMRSTDNNVP